MKYIKILSVFILIFFITFSCNIDNFSIISDYEDITVVYGLLDQREQTIYLKINKAFLGPGDAITYATEKDSSNYANKLSVKIKEYNPDGNFTRELVFDTTTLFTKDSGAFYAPDQPIYYYTFSNDDFAEIIWNINYPQDTIGLDTLWLFDDHRYELEIYNQQLDKYITSETILIENFNISKPLGASIGSFEDEPGKEKEITWQEAENGSLYEVSLDFTYVEIKYGGESDTLSINLTSVATMSNSYTYPSASFFASCESKIPYEDPAKEDEIQLRKIGNITITVSAAAEDFHKYLMVFKPSTGIVQEKPNFTNIENGIGIFSSRYRRINEKSIQPEFTLDALQQRNIKF